MKLALVLVTMLGIQLVGLCQPPSQATAAGYTQLVFNDDFTAALDVGFATTGHKWNANLWWKPVPPTSVFKVSGGILTITGDCGGVDLCTQYHDASGGTYFLGGYFEAEIWCTDWSSFWLFCADRPKVWGNLVLPSNPLTWTNELDIIETDPVKTTIAVCTLHSNSSSDGGVPDQINSPNNLPLGIQLEQAWHIYGVLWTQSLITWYVDNVKIASSVPFPSSWQPVQLVFSAAPKGVNGGNSTVIPPVTKVKWVRVWH